MMSTAIARRVVVLFSAASGRTEAAALRFKHVRISSYSRFVIIVGLSNSGSPSCVWWFAKYTYEVKTLSQTVESWEVSFKSMAPYRIRILMMKIKRLLFWLDSLLFLLPIVVFSIRPCLNRGWRLIFFVMAIISPFCWRRVAVLRPQSVVLPAPNLGGQNVWVILCEQQYFVQDTSSLNTNWVDTLKILGAWPPAGLAHISITYPDIN